MIPIAPHFRFAVLLALGALLACQPSSSSSTGETRETLVAALRPCSCSEEAIFCNGNACVCRDPTADAGAPRLMQEKCSPPGAPGPGTGGICLGTCNASHCYCNRSGECLCGP